MVLLKKLKGVFRRQEIDSELNDEMRFHLEKQIETNLMAGMSAEEARRHALVEFGGVQQTREAVHEVRWAGFLDKFLQDIRYAFRILRKSPVFTSVAVLTLALGIGMNTAIFSVIDAVLFRSLPVRDPQSLVVLKWDAHKEPTVMGLMNFGDCNDRMDRVHPAGCSLPLPVLKSLLETNQFSGVAAVTGFGQMDLGGNGTAKRIQGQFASGNYFSTLGIKPAAGRLLSEADDQPDAAPVAVLHYKFWQSDFGGAQSAIGKTVRLNNKTYMIVGVTEPGFTSLSLANQYDLWVPLARQKELVSRWFPGQDGPGFFGYVFLGRLKPGVTVSQAQAAADVAFRNATLQGESPVFKSADDPHLRLVDAQKELRGRYDLTLRPLLVLMLCVGIILLIACANVAGLLLARAASREREMAVRLALGARRVRLLMQLLVESVSLSMVGGALGLLLAAWGARILVAMLSAGSRQAPLLSAHMDWRVLAFAEGIAILTGLLFGLAPAMRGVRVDLTPSLKSADPSGTAGLRRQRFSMGNLLVATQVCLAVLVLATAGLLVRTLGNLKTVDPGFDTNNLLLFGVDPKFAGYKGAQVGHLYGELRQKFAALPGVKSVTYSWTPLLSGGQMATMFHRPGTPVDSKDQVQADIMEVGPGFLSTLRIPLQAGRDLTSAEFTAAANKPAFEPNKTPSPVLVNQAFVRKFFPQQNPLGQNFGDSMAEGPFPASPGYQIVGVVGDVKYADLRKDINPTIYLAISDGAAFFELRTAGDPAAFIPAVRNSLSSVEANLAMFQIDTQKGAIDRQLSDDRMVAQLSSFFGLLALLLACMGLYGLLSYEVSRRTREIGIRMAIGAQAGNVVRLVMAQAVLVAGLGAIAGVAISLGIGRVVSTFLYGVKAGDPLTLIGVIALLVVVALLACVLPARRATRVDPLVALRYE